MKLSQRVQQFLIISVLVLGMTDCKDQSTNPGGNPPPNNQSHTIAMSGMVFSPSTMTVAKGTTVTWQNNDGFAHTATSDSLLWDTGNIPGGSSKAIVFNTAGTFTYNCIYHKSMGMTGTIVVQ